MNNIDFVETEITKRLFNRCKTSDIGITKELLLDICKWKSERFLHHVRSNSDEFISYVLAQSALNENDLLKLHILTALTGINIPVASAVLMFGDPNKYPVIDTRVWQLLFDFGIIQTNKNGKNFNLVHWEEYLTVLRSYARKYNKSVRWVEKKLYDEHQVTHPTIRRDR